ncbi:MAG TPA: alpha/beta hydrolase-fold protein [Opitutaceae bacterium]
MQRRIPGISLVGWIILSAAWAWAAPRPATAQVAAVDLQPGLVFVRAGATHTLKANIRPERYQARDLQWSSQDPSVARVDAGGTVTALRAGRTYLFVKGGANDQATDMCRLIVYDDSNSLRFSGKTATVDATGERLALNLPRDDVVALVCRLRNAGAADARVTVQMDHGAELALTAPAGNRPTDVSPNFRYDFAGAYRFGLTAGNHTVHLSVPPGVSVDEVRLVGETGEHDRFASHLSAVMGKRRWYRIFLPPDYDATRDRLPVLYYLHGWGGRVFKEGVPGSHMDLGELARRVARDRVIVVVTDGQVHWDAGEDITRYAPYNLFLPHDSPVLWEDYFAELVRQIDATYRTIPNRSGRALLGFSMGGQMAYRIGERFPDLLASINPCCGSNEGFYGAAADLTYVRVSDYLENLRGVRLRIHDTQSDYLEPGNARVWQAVQREELPHSAWALFPGVHAIDPAGGTAAFDQAFDWAVDAFRHPLAPPSRWNALEFIPRFEVWDYQVSSDGVGPGLTELHGVTRGGFRVATLSALPDGGPRSEARVTVVTAPAYRPDTDYEVADFDETQGTLAQRTERSDGSGRLHLTFDGRVHQVGLHRAGDPAEVVALGGLAGLRPFLPVGEETTIQIKLYNRGASAAHGLRGFVSSPEPGVEIGHADFAIDALAPGEVATLSVPVIARVEPPRYAAPFALRLDVTVRADSGERWRDEINVVPRFEAPSVDAVLEPQGGNWVLKVGGRPQRVFSDDPALLKVADVPLIQSDNPEDAGMYSLIRFAPGTPPGHVARCLVRTETVIAKECAVAVKWGRADVSCP